VRASEYVRKLRELIAEHGDLDIEDAYGDQLDVPEFSEAVGDNPAVFVAADTA
jgi:hypothetical protein